VAFPNRPEVDEAFFQLGSTLLDSAGTVAFATHDGALVQRLRDRIKEKPPIAGAYEFQMLYGIRSEEQIRLAKEGEPVRVLISYGPAWFPWYMRRLAERPANVWFVLKNLFRR
jgi:proline dehydrogenase